MDMFVNYENIPTSYIPNNTTVCSPNTYIRKKPLEEYDYQGNLIGYSWYYGDEVVLELVTTGNVIYDEYAEDAEVYLRGKKIQIQFFDFRYEVIYDCIQNASEVVRFFIDNRTSKRFVRGAYRCKVTLIDPPPEPEEGEEEQDPLTYTLMNIDDYIFMIK